MVNRKTSLTCVFATKAQIGTKDYSKRIHIQFFSILLFSQSKYNKTIFTPFYTRKRRNDSHRQKIQQDLLLVDATLYCFLGLV